MDYLKQIKQGNDEILKFLVKNSNKLQGHQMSIWRRTEFKDSKSLVRELIKKTKNPANEFKIGLEDTKKRIISYNYKKRSDMESLLNSGNLGFIDIKISDQDKTAGAIKKFGTSS